MVRSGLKTKLFSYPAWLFTPTLVFLAFMMALFDPAGAATPGLQIEQITVGEQHHFFGYIGQTGTIPWNKSGRYIVAMQTDFHDHMPAPNEAAKIILIDTKQDYNITVVDSSRAWNFQQGTMLYWNPDAPETQFFFNDRDLQSNKIFTVLYDIEQRERIKEYRFDDVSIANAGVAQNGGRFAALNYGRLARLRPVTGYPEAFDWTVGDRAPDDDGIFIVDIASGEKQLLVSFKALADLTRAQTFRTGSSGRLSALPPGASEDGVDAKIDSVSLYINHTLWNRNDDLIYFYLRGKNKNKSIWIDMPCTIKPDGTGLTPHTTLLGGHPEWMNSDVIIGDNNKRQVLYDVSQKKIIGQIGTPDIFPKPGGDISLSPNGRWFVNGYSKGGKNYYVIFDRMTGIHLKSPAFSRGPYTKGELRIDPAPRWNRTNDAVLVPGWTEQGTRQLFVIKLLK